MIIFIYDFLSNFSTFTTIQCMPDKAYRAVLAENQALDAYKYHLVGGSAGTVSPSKCHTYES